MVAMLKTVPEPPLSGFDRGIAFLTTPFKRLGVFGWRDTRCLAQGSGIAVRDAQHSTDGFWTLDVRLDYLRIDTLLWRRAGGDQSRFVRIEVRPEAPANAAVRAAPIRDAQRLEFAGRLMIDLDGPFLEVHPHAPMRVSSAR